MTIGIAWTATFPGYARELATGCSGQPEHWEDEPRPDPVEYIVRQINGVGARHGV